ncbi:translation initiation factor IF-2 [Rhodotorula toruloides]|uniref:Translation initiation factor IF-2 n=1 Tax=Rhodotorula toruloides TaxID=5286 RepID=A0A511KEQ3_RHOTO|nr:translation initiation factor IF-2 [Rhodotorula toruloides]
MSAARIVAVVGATGHQGSGVVAALLSSTSFSVRALSSNLSGSRATSLLALHDKYVKEGRLEVVKADLNDRESLEKALKGTYGLFAAMAIAQNEVEQGKTLVDVAKGEGIKHFVYSSLPSIAKASGGKYTNVVPFEHKAQIEEYAKEKLDNVTILIAGAFYSNLYMPLYSRHDNIAIYNVVGSLDLHTGWLDDGKDVGTYAAAAFTKGPAATAGKTYPLEAPRCTMKHIAAQYEAITGEKTTVQATEIDIALTGFPEFLKPSLGEMFRFLNEIGPASICYGTMKPEDDKSFEDLGVKASSFQAFVERTGFRVGGDAK